MSWRWPGPRSLKMQFIASAVAIQIVALALLTWASLSTTSNAMLEQARQQLNGVTPVLNASLAAPLLEEDLAILQERIERIVESNRFSYLEILDTQGRTVLQSRGREDRHTHAAMSEIPLKIGDFTVGRVIIGLDDRPIAEALSQLRGMGIRISTIAVLFTLVLLFLSSFLLTRPLQDLTRASRRLATGDLAARIEPHGSSELGELGRAFNKMAASLATQHTDLEQKGERIRLLMDSTAEAICGVDRSGRCTFANRACLEMFGFAEESEISGVHLTEILSVPDSYAETLAQGLYCHRDDRQVQTRDGRILSLECWSHPILQEGKATGAVITMLDISERRRAESLLRDSESRYRLLVENQTDLVVKVDCDGIFSFVSPSYCETFGIPAEQLIGRPFMPLVREEDRIATAEAMRDLYRPPYECKLEQRAETARGWRWLSWANKAVRDEHGQVVAIVGVGRDITEQKLTEQALQASEVRLRAIVDNSPALILMRDLEGEVTVVSRHPGQSTGSRVSGPVIEAMSEVMDRLSIEADRANLHVAPLDHGPVSGPRCGCCESYFFGVSCWERIVIGP